MSVSPRDTVASPDAVLIGGGIMSATLAVLLHKVQPTWTIQIVEALDKVAEESSNPWNNAGTGHAALCELNYTKEQSDGSYDISKAIEINEAFELSKQFWAALSDEGTLNKPSDFIRLVPHMSFVRGDRNIDSLRRRFETMKKHHFFSEMEFTDDQSEVASWAPLLTEGRASHSKVALTRVASGTDVDFGSLTRTLTQFLASLPNVHIATSHHVRDLKKTKDGKWMIKVRNTRKEITRKIITPFVFVGAGGASLPLLQKSDIPEGKGFGGFPVSGQFLVCSTPEIVERHSAKVYGKADVGAPPMSVPHLDTRVIDGQRSLLFGPFAGFSPKFLKSGSLLDLPGSVRISNILPMLAVGKDNIDLTRYLIEQCLQTEEDRLDALRDFFPGAEAKDWTLRVAGQRVQIIKNDPVDGGKLQFGTEVVAASDGSLAALLGASPGASTAVAIMLEVLERCFPDQISDWIPILKELVPSYGQSLDKDPELYKKLRSATDDALGLN